LASCEDFVHELRPWERVPGETGTHFHSIIVDQDSLSGKGVIGSLPGISAIRPLRTRTMGGVGAGG